mgnify:CR=1 FL=1
MIKLWELRKLNDQPLLLNAEYVNEDDPESSLFFEYMGVHHYWDNIVSRNSAWFPKFDFDLPDFIHGQDQTDFWNPLFIELIEFDFPGYPYEFAINVWHLEVFHDKSIYHQES